MKPSDVKNKDDFECLMRERKEKYGYGCGFISLITCDESGAPVGEYSKRKVCEIQKIAMGSETAYMFCGEPRKLSRDIKNSNGELVKAGTLVREVCLELSVEEHWFWKRIYTKQITGVKSELQSGISVSGPVSTCAFQGGCD